MAMCSTVRVSVSILAIDLTPFSVTYRADPSALNAIVPALVIPVMVSVTVSFRSVTATEWAVPRLMTRS
jgi:hypothetical protein